MSVVFVFKCRGYQYFILTVLCVKVTADISHIVMAFPLNNHLIITRLLLPCNQTLSDNIERKSLWNKSWLLDYLGIQVIFIFFSKEETIKL